jgi:hypothetical protein
MQVANPIDEGLHLRCEPLKVGRASKDHSIGVENLLIQRLDIILNGALFGVKAGSTGCTGCQLVVRETEKCDFCSLGCGCT